MLNLAESRCVYQVFGGLFTILLKPAERFVDYTVVTFTGPESPHFKVLEFVWGVGGENVDWHPQVFYPFFLLPLHSFVSCSGNHF